MDTTSTPSTDIDPPEGPDALLAALDAVDPAQAPELAEELAHDLAARLDDPEGPRQLRVELKPADERSR